MKIKSLLATAMIILAMSCVAHADCDEACLQTIYERFDYWVKNYDHHGDDVSQMFASFPSDDARFVMYGVEYEGYLRVGEIAKEHGHKILWAIGESGYYAQKLNMLAYIKSRDFCGDN